jgi:hypothetical protein
MANHLRRQIREAIGTAVTGLTTTTTNVFQSRVYPAETSKLPCLLIFTRSETMEPETIHAPRSLSRVLTVEVNSVTKATADLDDSLDQICKEVEIALAAPSAVLALSDDIVLKSTEIEMAGTQEKPVGVARMVYDVSYHSLETTPDVAQ